MFKICGGLYSWLPVVAVGFNPFQVPDFFQKQPWNSIICIRDVFTLCFNYTGLRKHRNKNQWEQKGLRIKAVIEKMEVG
jgi:hypothetical protein